MSTKQKAHAFGKDTYYLGKRKTGENIWMEGFRWDCDWYWSGGYVESYHHNAATIKGVSAATDINSHQHFDGLFFGEFGIDKWQREMKSSPLNEREVWILHDLMKSFYIIKEAAEVTGRGGAHYTSHNHMTPNPELAATLNKIIENEIAPAVYALLSPAGEQ